MPSSGLFLFSYFNIKFIDYLSAYKGVNAVGPETITDIKTEYSGLNENTVKNDNTIEFAKG
jgi:hypothetical protein